MSNSTSIGRGPAAGGNENHDGDPGNTTMGESVQQEPPAGSAAAQPQAPELPAGVAGGSAKPGIGEEPESMPDGPNVGPSPWEVDAARGKLPPK